MPRYRYEGKFKCDNCGKQFIKKGTCKPKVCPGCSADKALLKLVGKQEL